MTVDHLHVLLISTVNRSYLLGLIVRLFVLQERPVVLLQFLSVYLQVVVFIQHVSMIHIGAQQLMTPILAILQRLTRVAIRLIFDRRCNNHLSLEQI